MHFSSGENVQTHRRQIFGVTPFELKIKHLNYNGADTVVLYLVKVARRVVIMR